MSDADDRTKARAELVFLAQPATASPALSAEGDGNDIDTVLDRHRQATTWAAETEYVPGAVVLPTERNGHCYRCVRGGTSGEEEPSGWPTRQGARVMDGDGEPPLLWVEDGPDFPNIYDVRGAMHELCVLRATRSAGKFNLSLGGQRFNRSEVYEHWMREAASWAPVRFG